MKAMMIGRICEGLRGFCIWILSVRVNRSFHVSLSIEPFVCLRIVTFHKYNEW